MHSHFFPRRYAPVTGKFRPDQPLGEDQHHEGWNKALQDALNNIGLPKGYYQANIQYSAIIDVYNPGGVIEYEVTISPNG